MHVIFNALWCGLVLVVNVLSSLLKLSHSLAATDNTNYGTIEQKRERRIMSG